MRLKQLFTPEKLFVRFFTSWCLAGFLSLLFVKTGFDTLAFSESLNLLIYLLWIAGGFALLTAAEYFLPSIRVAPYALFVISFAYSSLMLYRKREFYFSLGILFLMCLIGYYLLRDDKMGLLELTLSSKQIKVIIAACVGFYVLFVGGLTSLRYTTYYTSTFDLGIFSQMFYYMKETGLPMTTCERNELLSHFAIHVSPIFYLLLPGYCIFPTPIYLQVMQALILASGVIPVYLLARHYELSNKAVLLICVAYCFFPYLAGGCFYDIHENLFLAPCILWLFYFYEKRKWLLFYIFAILTLMVKEDAAIYVACIALFLLICRKEWKHGAILMMASVLYFGLAYTFIQLQGRANMLGGHFSNLLADPQDGPFSIVKNLFLNPAYVFNEAMTEEKVKYVFLMLLPLAFLPLLGKKLSQLVLLIPFLVINLLPDYPYHHDIGFQYGFGVTACFFYLAITNAAGMGRIVRKWILSLAAMASVLLFVSTMSGHIGYLNRATSDRGDFQKMDAYLAEIPEEASVTATGFLVPKLSQRKVIYDFDRDLPEETEYIVIDIRSKTYDEEIAAFEEQGYTQTVNEEGLLVILHKEIG